MVDGNAKGKEGEAKQTLSKEREKTPKFHCYIYLSL
jgi:hypothetical protein